MLIYAISYAITGHCSLWLWGSSGWLVRTKPNPGSEKRLKSKRDWQDQTRLKAQAKLNMSLDSYRRYRADQSEPGQEEPGDTGDSGCEFDTGGFKHEKKSEAGAGDDDEDGRELARRRSNVGWVIAIIGLLILGSSTGRWGLHGGHAGGVFWAIAAVLIGLVMARSSSEPGREGPTNWAVLSRIDHRQPGWVVRSTSYSAVLGNVLLDLSVARIPDSDTYLDITAVLGGVQVILPPELPVSCEGTAILGSVSAFGQSASGGLASRDFARHGSDGSRSSLRIRCRAILGSVDIR